MISASLPNAWLLWLTLVVAITFGLICSIYVIQMARIDRKRDFYYHEIEKQASQIALHIAGNFLVQPCSRCYENLMEVVQVTPNARSVLCKCSTCGKKYWAPAATSEASLIKDWLETLNKLRFSYNQIAREGKVIQNVDIGFTTSEASLPYQQTTREPIPASMRSEVWRRDGGKCVTCESQQNLQFDHIIPVSNGGDTSVQNLQLLCRSCNLKKHQQI